MAIIASFTNVSSSYITTLHKLGERNDKLYCSTIISVERQPTKHFRK